MLRIYDELLPVRTILSGTLALSCHISRSDISSAHAAWSVVTSTLGLMAWKGLNAGAKEMAASAIDLLTLPEKLAGILAEFREYSREHPYKPFIPDDAVPPLDLNKELMEKWRSVMEEHYEEL